MFWNLKITFDWWKNTFYSNGVFWNFKISRLSKTLFFCFLFFMWMRGDRPRQGTHCNDARTRSAEGKINFHKRTTPETLQYRSKLVVMWCAVSDCYLLSPTQNKKKIFYVILCFVEVIKEIFSERNLFLFWSEYFIGDCGLFNTQNY